MNKTGASTTYECGLKTFPSQSDKSLKRSLDNVLLHNSQSN